MTACASTIVARRPAFAAVVPVAPQAFDLEPQPLNFKPKEVFVLVFVGRRVLIAAFVEVPFQFIESVAKLFQGFHDLAPERFVLAVVLADVRPAQILNRLLQVLHFPPEFPDLVDRHPVERIVPIAARLAITKTPPSKAFEIASQQPKFTPKAVSKSRLASLPHRSIPRC
jgi:hypothetical protein